MVRDLIKKSSYQRYKKKPYRYSAEYRSWREAVGRGLEGPIKQADQNWRKRFFSDICYQIAA